MTYQVIVHETVELTYKVEADSPEAAYSIWEESTDQELGSPEEDTLGTEFLCTIDPATGKSYNDIGEEE